VKHAPAQLPQQASLKLMPADVCINWSRKGLVKNRLPQDRGDMGSRKASCMDTLFAQHGFTKADIAPRNTLQEGKQKHLSA
jgi:hypothetical protein